MKRDKYPPPTREQLQAAFDALRAACPSAWPDTLDETLARPHGSRLVHARAMQHIRAADLRARQQYPLRYRLPDGSWRTRKVFGARTEQLAISEDTK